MQTLTNVVSYLKVRKVDIAKLTKQFSVDKVMVKEMLADMITFLIR